MYMCVTLKWLCILCYFSDCWFIYMCRWHVSLKTVPLSTSPFWKCVVLHIPSGNSPPLLWHVFFSFSVSPFQTHSSVVACTPPSSTFLSQCIKEPIWSAFFGMAAAASVSVKLARPRQSDNMAGTVCQQMRAACSAEGQIMNVIVQHGLLCPY